MPKFGEQFWMFPGYTGRSGDMRVPNYGPASARIMLVGEAPGGEEEKEGKPFVGPAGKLLRKSLMAVGIDPDACYFANLSHVRPPDNKLLKFFDRSGMPNDIVLDGMLQLKADIERIRPHVIVSLGNFPLWALTQKAEWKEMKDRWGKKFWAYTGIHDWRGSILESTMVPGMKVIPTFHPSYILQEGANDQGTFETDLARVLRESEFPEIRRPVKELIIDPQGAQRDEVMDRLLHQPLPDYAQERLGVKTMITTDIEYVKNNLLCVGMTSGRDWAAVIPIRDAGDLEFCRGALESGVPIAAQNSMFDCSILEWWYRLDLFKHLTYDTMLAAHAINIELPKGLDYLVSIYTDQPYYKSMVDWKLIKRGLQDLQIVYDYNAIDVWTQHEVMEEQIKWDFNDPEDRVNGERAWRTFQFEMALLRPLWHMSRRGIRIDRARIDSLSKQAEMEGMGLNSILNQLVGFKVNVKSVTDIRKILFDQLGLPVLKESATTKLPSTDDKTIAELVNHCKDDVSREIVSLIRDIRNRRDLRSKFADVEMDTDERCRGMYSPAGTVTGRLSSKKFYPTGKGLQQQNIPRDERARSVFLPDRERVFIYADLERAESLVVAHLTQDPEMLRVHGPGIDAHKELAAYLFNKPIEEITKDERYLGKQTRHAGNYMQGPQTFMSNVNQKAAKTGVSVTYAEAKKYIYGYRDLHPFLRQWWEEVEAELWSTRCLFNMVGPNGKGRRRIFYGHVRSIIPEAVAYNPQSTVGDTLNVALLNLEGIPSEYMLYLGLWEQYKEWSMELQEYGYESLLQVHDAVGLQVNERDLDRAVPLIRKLMTIPLTIPKTLQTFAIPVEIKSGPSWGEAETLHEPEQPIAA